MALDYKVYKSQRVVPLRFMRAVAGQPVLGKPDIDDHGYYRVGVTAGNDHGHVVGVSEGNESEVKVKRERIGKDAALFVTSSDTAKMTVTASDGTNTLPKSEETTLKIKGVAGITGANPNTAKAEIRFGSATGPIVGEISVWVFKKVNVKLTPHNVTIRTATAAGIASRVNINSVIDLVKAFWEPCGVAFTVDPVQNENVTFAAAGVAAWKGEINTLSNTNYVADSINAYFVNQIDMKNPTQTGVLGLGFSRPNSVAFSLTNPGIILGDTNVSGTDRHSDIHYLANDLAHEIGHFFTLEHVDKKQGAATRKDTWAMRRLMHNFNKRGTAAGNMRHDVGYGADYRGGLLTMKDLTDSANAVNHSTDAESLTARGVINSAAGPY